MLQSQVKIRLVATNDAITTTTNIPMENCLKLVHQGIDHIIPFNKNTLTAYRYLPKEACNIFQGAGQVDNSISSTLDIESGLSCARRGRKSLQTALLMLA